MAGTRQRFDQEFMAGTVRILLETGTVRIVLETGEPIAVVNRELWGQRGHAGEPVCG